MLKTEYKEWKALLMKQPKEKLVDIILLKMLKDHYFYRQVEDAVVIKNRSVQDSIKEYKDRVADEMKMNIPNVDYLESISEDLLEAAKSLQSLLEQVQICITIIKTLDDAINNGAGFENENEFYLYDVIKECSDFLVKVTKEKSVDISKAEYDQVIDLLEKASKDNLTDETDALKESITNLKEVGIM